MATESTEHTLREVCRHCNGTFGYISTRGGQDCVYCCQCRRFLYNAPKTETGRAVRSVSTVRDGIKPKQKSRILLRANGRCELCGKSSAHVDLHVSHLISVKVGFDNGLTDEQLNDDENLSAMCAECNLGLGSQPVTLRFAVALLLNRLAFKEGCSDGTGVDPRGTTPATAVGVVEAGQPGRRLDKAPVSSIRFNGEIQ